jgi:hypothetical protein
VTEDCEIPAVKEIEDSVVHSALSYPQFVNAVFQEIRNRAAQLVPELGQSFNCGDARLISALVWMPDLLQPIEHWNIVFIFLVEDDFSTRHRSKVQDITILLLTRGFVFVCSRKNIFAPNVLAAPLMNLTPTRLTQNPGS